MTAPVDQGFTNVLRGATIVASRSTAGAHNFSTLQHCSTAVQRYRSTAVQPTEGPMQATPGDPLQMESKPALAAGRPQTATSTSILLQMQPHLQVLDGIGGCVGIVALQNRHNGGRGPVMLRQWPAKRCLLRLPVQCKHRFSAVGTEQELQPDVQSSTFPSSQIPMDPSSGMMHAVGALLALQVTPRQASTGLAEANAHPSRLLGAILVELRLQPGRARPCKLSDAYADTKQGSCLSFGSAGVRQPMVSHSPMLHKNPPVHDRAFAVQLQAV